MNTPEKIYLRLLPIILIFYSCASTPAGNSDTPSAYALYQSAVILVKQGEIASAEKALLQAREMEPDNASYALYLGWLYIQHLHDAQEAVMHLEAARDLDPTKELLWANLSRTYRTLQRWEEAGEAYLKALEEKERTNPGIPLYTFEAGRMYWNDGKHHQGLELMRKAWLIRQGDNREHISSRYADLLYLHARKELALGHYSEALEMFTFLDECVANSPDEDSFMLTHFASYFYSIDYRKVIHWLAHAEPAEEAVTVNVLSVLPAELQSKKEEMETIELATDLFGVLVLFLSEGSLVLSFDDVFIDSTTWSLVTQTSYTATENWGILDVVNANQTAVSLLPAINQGLKTRKRKIYDYDTIILYFSPEGIENPRPSASVLYQKDFERWFGNREQMGCISIPLIYYHTSEGVYLHEYFHLLENRYGISPKHGFSPDHHYKENKRKYFPEWTGSGQFSYYHYHFLNTLNPAGYAKAVHP